MGGEVPERDGECIMVLAEDEGGENVFGRGGRQQGGGFRGAVAGVSCAVGHY